MKQLYLRARSLLLWTLSLIHFGFGVPFILTLGAIFGQRRIDPLLSLMCRNILRLAGVRLEVRYAPGFDPKRTCFFVSNHVNLFDPFVLYCALPQFFRGLELESHFNIPVYGSLMKRFGNVPVPDNRTTVGIKRLFRLTKQSLQNDVSLLVFAEGGRTATGRVEPFSDGVFVMARQFKYPIVPVSIVGAFEFKRKDDWMLRPAKIVIHVHDLIETDGLTKAGVADLHSRVYEIVSKPVHAAISDHGIENPKSKIENRIG